MPDARLEHTPRRRNTSTSAAQCGQDQAQLAINNGQDSAEIAKEI
jgi:hypothetical protein